MNRRSGLGKGLGSLIPTDAIAADTQAALREIPVSAIGANEYQPRARFDEEALVSLTDSVRELGVLQPILVRESGENRYELIAGERRWRAARRAGLATIPAIVCDVDDRHSLEQALVENLHREDLNALEEGAAYQQLIDEFNLTQDEVASRVGKSRSAISNTLRLFQLPGSVQRLVASGELSAGHGRALLGTPDRADQERLAQRVVAEGLNVRQVEELVRSTGDDSSRPTPRPSTPTGVGETKPAALLELERLLGDHLDTRVTLSMAKGRGRMMIEFADLEDLERVYRAMLAGE
ncbi:MAG: ParB/RepB/Spo0J family partition protein [Acidimicrobiales bacterium]